MPAVIAQIEINPAGAGWTTNSTVGLTVGDNVLFRNQDNTNVVSWLWTITYQPPGAAAVWTGTGTATSTTATDDITLPLTGFGNFRITLYVDDGGVNDDTDSIIIGIPSPNLGLIAPAAGETTEVGGATKGWADSFWANLDALDGLSVAAAAGDTDTYRYTLLGSVSTYAAILPADFDGAFVVPENATLKRIVLHRGTAGTLGSTSIQIQVGGVDVLVGDLSVAYNAPANFAQTTNFVSAALLANNVITAQLTGVEDGSPQDISVVVLLEYNPIAVTSDTYRFTLLGLYRVAWLASGSVPDVFDGAWIAPGNGAVKFVSLKRTRDPVSSSGNVSVDLLKNGVSIFGINPIPIIAFGADGPDTRSVFTTASFVAGDRLEPKLMTVEDDGDPTDIAVTVSVSI